MGIIMVILPEDLSNKSDEEILDSMHGAMYDSNHYKHCINCLQLRYIRGTLEATKRLKAATWVLVAATVILAVEAIVSLLLRK